MRRLALYSDQILDITDAIDARIGEWLAGTAGRIGYLPSSPDPERSWFQAQSAYYTRLGFSLSYFGLEEEFDPSHLGDLLACHAIHMTGGNTFQFLYWLRERGMLPVLQDYSAAGGVLIGVSAGAILMTPEIGTSLLCGDVPYRGIDGGPALNLVDFAFAPHFDGSREDVKKFSHTFPGPVYAVKDGGGIIVEGDQIEAIGPVEVCHRGAWLT